MSIVIIQNRRGGYTDFNPASLRPGEFAIVQEDDPNTSDGKAIYLCVSANNVVRLTTANELGTYLAQVEQSLTQAQTAASNAQTASQNANSKATEASNAAVAANSAKEAAQALLDGAEATINAYTTEAVESATDDINAAYENRVADINNKIDQIINLKFDADQLATQALQKANVVENDVAEFSSALDMVKSQLTTLNFKDSQKVAGGYVDVSGYLILTDENGDQIGDRLGPFIGGGGGGGGTVVDAVLTATNTTGWISTTISEDNDCNVSILWSSIENGLPTGNGTATIKVNNIVKGAFEIPQGEITINLVPYLNSGTNNVKVVISDTYGQERPVSFNISVITLRISSTFNTSNPFDGIISFPYTPVGEVAKTVYFVLDGTVINTQQTSVSNRQLTYTIPAQSHGAHVLRVYFESEINGQTVRSNELYYEFISLESLNNTPIIISPFNKQTVTQYDSVVIPYTVYSPSTPTSNITLSVNNEVVSEQTVDRSEHSYTFRANTFGEFTFRIATGNVSKVISFTVTELDIDVEAETENLVLYLSSEGRSNNEATPETWTYENIETTFTGFNGTNDRWQTDDDGNVVCRVSGNARLNIGYKPAEQDFRTTGKTIELEFATRDVLDYDAVILSCMQGGRGFEITAQKALLKSEQSEISTQYKENEHVRISFVVYKRSEDRLLFIYINGIASGVVQYPDDDDFSQVNPVNITVGSNSCTIDLYCIRVYNNNLTKEQILNNWIADTQNGGELLDRYNRNNVYDNYGNIVISKLPTTTPYMIINARDLPQYKGNKLTCGGSFTNPALPSKSFTFTNCQIDVQGTSSQYYERKNYKMKFNGGFVTTSGTLSKYALNNDAIPVKTFTMKADVASSEGANNVELARLYNEACPYKTPAQIANNKVRQGIDGFPMVIFWNDGENTTFLGKYNFNNDKATEETFGFATPDESIEILNNTSTRVLWKNDDYSGTDYLNDFEWRFPDVDPPFTDATQLQEFATWVKSTDTEQATGDALETPVIYDGVTYTNDTAEYRLAKFKAEAGDYMEMQSTLFYYLFTELFLMVDSRAKNAFPSFIGSEVVE